MGLPYLIDSNVFIEYSGKKFPPLIEQKLDAIFNEEFYYSIITKVEVLGWENATKPEIDYLSSFFTFGEQYDVTDEIGNVVIQMRRTITKRNLPDLIIAATAIVNSYTLLTNNTKHFRNIPGLKFDNPWDWD